MMQRWPLRWKVALWSAALAVVATIAGATTTWLYMLRAQVAALDRRLELDVRELFRDVENFAGGADRDPRYFRPELVPLALHRRLLEVTTEGGVVLYRSPSLPGPVSDDGIREFHSRRIAGRAVRMGEFSEKGLRVRVGVEQAEVNQIGRDILEGIFFAIPTVLVIVFLGARWVAHRSLAPVEALRQAAADISPQNLDARLPVPPTRDEIAGLITVLNTAFDRLQRSFEQAKRFSADASHQLKTPIAVLRAGIEEILNDPQTPARQAARAEALLQQLRQLTSISENLLLLARADAGRLELQREEFDLREVLDGALDDALVLAEPRGLAVQESLPAALPLRADRSAMAMIVQNLVENAVKYADPGGTVRLAAHAADGWAEVNVANTGAPIAPEAIPRIFDRFYRGKTDKATTGHGLGLSIARELAVAHGGELVLTRSDDAGTEFRLRVPQGAA